MGKNLQKLLTGGMLMAVFCCAHNQTEAQFRGRHAQKAKKVATDTSQKSKKDAAASALASLTSPRSDAPKPYKEVITAKAIAYKSFLTVQKIDDKYYLEVPDSVLGREILVINRIGMAPADFRNGDASIGYAGDIIGQQLFHFSKGEGNRLFIRTKSYRERSADTSANGLARLLERNNMEPIINSFAVKAVNDSAHTSVIEITDLLGQDNNLFGFSNSAKSITGISNILTDRSYLDSVKSYSDNIGFTFMRTYGRTVKGSSASQPYTFRLHTGMILLPAVPMAARFADKRTAWQHITYIDFDSNPLGVINKDMITRWRLEPANRDAYDAGQLTAPLQSIRMYIDPAMPSKWKPYIKAGIEAWNAAFEKAGFRQAIQVIQEPAAAGISYLDNVHKSAVVFMPGAGRSTGSMIVDPRSGEILQVQMNFYLTTLDSLYKQYFIQAGALDKAAQKPAFDDGLMGRLVQVWAMQTMGKLLGLKINAGASFGNKVTDLRNNSWLASNAFNGSAMDPVLVNYVVQPEDRVDLNNLFPRISEADEWMINWGYRVIPGQETPVLNKWIRDWPAKAAELYIGEVASERAVVIDPRNQLGDLGNDAVQSARLGINNLKRIVPHIVEWTSEPASGNELANDIYTALLNRYVTYARYVVNQLGGLYVNVRNSDKQGNVFTAVSSTIQKKAVQFLHQEVFETPLWLADKTLYSRTTQCFDSVMNLQRALLGDVLNVHVLNKLQNRAQEAPASAYMPLAFLTDLRAGIFAELKDNRAVSLPRRELQQEYITRLLALTDAFAKGDNDLPAVVSLHARQLLALLKEKQAACTGMGQLHIARLHERLYNGIYKNESTAKKK